MSAMSVPPELPSNVVSGYGANGNPSLIATLAALQRLKGGAESLAAYGEVQWSRPTAEAGTLLPRLHAPDITLTAGDIYAIREGARQTLGGQIDLPARFVRTFGDKLLEVMPPSAPHMPQFLGLTGLGDVHIITPTLSQWKTKRLPHLSITLGVRLPEPGHWDTVAAENVKLLCGARHETVLDLIYPLDPRSPLARTAGEDVQTQLVGRVLAAQLIAHQHDAQNKRLAEVSQSVGTRVGTRGTFAGLAIGVAPVAAGNPRPVSRMLRWRLSADVGTGDIADCLRQATDLATRLLEDEYARTFAAPFDRTVSPYELLFVVPFALSDPRFGRIVRELRAWQTAEVPQAGTPLVVSGSGRLAPESGQRYYCLAAYIFAVPDELVLSQAEPIDRQVGK